MGAFLAKPNIDKHSECGDRNGLRYAVTAMQGWRINMEDAHTTLTSLEHIHSDFTDWAFFAIFDGHAGGEVARLGSEELLPTFAGGKAFSSAAIRLAKRENKTNDSIPIKEEVVADQIREEEIEDPLVTDMFISEGIRTGFIELDASIRRSSEVVSGRNRSGSTVTSVLLTKTKLFFGNCGDSRTLLSRNGEVFFETNDHKPTNDLECKRIIEAGGQVVTQRVNGSLAVSRAIGDFEYKKADHLDVCKQLVSPEPDVTAMNREMPNENVQGDEFIVLACDGIYDVMSSKDVCDFIRHRMQLTDNLEAIGSDLIDTCLHLDSKDNMSVIIVALPGAPKVCAVQQEIDNKLNLDIESCIKDYLAKNPHSTWESLGMVLRVVDNNRNLVLPPGGVHSKHIYIESILNRLTNKPEIRDA